MSKVKHFSPTLGYLSGLIVGRGKIYSSGRIVIEFAHAIPIIKGLAACPKCLSASTMSKALKVYTCKNSVCGNIDFIPIEKSYDQCASILNSLDNVIIPFLASGLKFEAKKTSNKSMTLLILDFDPASKEWQLIESIFGHSFDYHFGEIPKQIWQLEKATQVEFVNGILDSAGFCNKGMHQGSRTAADGTTTLRQRIYLQIVRNWKIVVQIENFLRNNFDVPIQTIRWAHPNIDDGTLVSFNEGTHPEREHQIKIHPEYLMDFKFRISHKQAIFQELADHNLSAGFGRENWLNSDKRIKQKDMTPNHPLERNLRFPIEVQRHFDKTWQINLALGCPDMVALKMSAKNPEVFELNGDIADSRSVAVVQKEIDDFRAILNAKYPAKPVKRVPLPKKSGGKGGRVILESETYPVLVDFYNSHVFKGKPSNGEFYEIATLTLSAFVNAQPEVFGRVLNTWDDYKIHVDLVGYNKRDGELFIVEAKVEPLTLEMLGQLLAYCLVAQPESAHLVSTEHPTTSLVNAISACPEILNYGEKNVIQIGRLDMATGIVDFL